MTDSSLPQNEYPSDLVYVNSHNLDNSLSQKLRELEDTQPIFVHIVSKTAPTVSPTAVATDGVVQSADGGDRRAERCRAAVVRRTQPVSLCARARLGTRVGLGAGARLQ